MAYIPPPFVPTPLGFPDFTSYQTAVISAFKACPPPNDPSCEDPRDALIAAALELWTTYPGSCGVVVCDAAGVPLNPAVLPSGQLGPGAYLPPGPPSTGAAPTSAPYSPPSQAPVVNIAPTGIVTPGGPGLPAGGAPQAQPRALGVGGVIAGGAAGGPVGIVIAIGATIVGILGGLFGGLFGGSPDFGKQIEQLAQAMSDIGNALSSAIAAVMHAMGSILKFLKGIWENVLHPLIDALKNVVTQIGHVFRDILPKIVDWVRKIRQRILDFYEHFIRPLILILQRVHTILSILAAFHIKWAARLDRQLQDIQARILKPMFWLLGQINSVVNILNWILDFKMILQRTLMINSLFATAGTWTKMFWNVQTGSLSYDSIFDSADAQRAPTPGQTQSDAQQFRDTGSGPFADPIAVFNNQAMQTRGGG